MSKAEIVEMLLRHENEISNLKAISNSTQQRALTQQNDLSQKVRALEVQQRSLWDKIKNIAGKAKDIGAKVVNKVGEVGQGVAQVAQGLTRDIPTYASRDVAPTYASRDVAPYNTRAINLDDLVSQTSQTMNECIELNKRMKSSTTRALPPPSYSYQNY
jgi:hypothetical protein